MASPKHKSRTLRDKPDRNGLGLPPKLARLPEAPVAIEQPVDRGSRIAFAVWLLAFAFLGSLVLWDLVTALLFR